MSLPFHTEQRYPHGLSLHKLLFKNLGKLWNIQKYMKVKAVKLSILHGIMDKNYIYKYIKSHK